MRKINLKSFCILLLAASALSESLFKLRDDEKCRSATIPQESWIKISNCGSENSPIRLIGFEPDKERMPPTAGLGFWVDLHFEALQTVYASTGRMIVSWNGLPFADHTEPIETLFDAGVCYSMRKYAYLKVAPAGNY